MNATPLTRLIQAVDQGDPKAAEDLIPLVYNELRSLAAHKMLQEVPGQTLQATALVHEAYLRLVHAPDQQWNSRRHFFAAAAEAMRRILIENARRKRSQKRGGDWERVEWTEMRVAVGTDDEQLLAVHAALEALEKENPKAAELIKLRFFVGLNGRDAARVLDIPERSATRLWAYARAWLFREMRKDPEALGVR